MSGLGLGFGLRGRVRVRVRVGVSVAGNSVPRAVPPFRRLPPMATPLLPPRHGYVQLNRMVQAFYLAMAGKGVAHGSC